MIKSKYTDFTNEILDLQANGKTAAEIADLFNKNYHIGATENSLRVYLKRYNDRLKEDENLDVENEFTVPEEDTVANSSESFRNKEKELDINLVKYGRLLNTLDYLKTEYEDGIKHFSAINDQLDMIIERFKNNTTIWEWGFFVVGCWIFSLMVALLAGYYIGYCYTRVAITFILSFCGIPCGVLIGLGFGMRKSRRKIMSQTLSQQCNEFENT